MQFAKQAISLYINGFLGLVWMAMLFHPLVYHVKIATWVNKDTITPLCLFVGLPMAYALGVAMNSLFGRLFSSMDDSIRVDVLKEDAEDMNIKIASEKYHRYRYKLFEKSERFYEYVDFHREGIRILRAMCVHALLVVPSFMTVWDDMTVKVAGYILLVLGPACVWFLEVAGRRASTCDSEGKKKGFHVLEWAFVDHALFFWVFWGLAFVTMAFSFRNKPYDGALVMVFPLALFVSCISFRAWRKKQKSYYKTIVNAKNAVLGKDA